MDRVKSEPDVESVSDQASSREPDGAYVGRTSADAPETEEETGAERRARERS